MKGTIVAIKRLDGLLQSRTLSSKEDHLVPESPHSHSTKLPVDTPTQYLFHLVSAQSATPTQSSLTSNLSKRQCRKRCHCRKLCSTQTIALWRCCCVRQRAVDSYINSSSLDTWFGMGLPSNTLLPWPARPCYSCSLHCLPGSALASRMRPSV